MKYILIIISLYFCLIAHSQNCEYILFQGDSLKYKACKLGEVAEKFFYQFDKEYQQIYDASIETCPYFATAYHAKSVAYLKSGNFIEWKKLIDKAVELEPKEYLGYRASCRFQFVHDYIGAIKDIEKLSSLIDYDIGFTSDGDYHLDIVKAICYKELGDTEKAIQLFNSKINEQGYNVGIYDYYHLGILYMNTGAYKKSITTLNKQININESAEVYYHLALAYKGLGDKKNYENNIIKAKELYQSGNIMTGLYTAYIDKIYLKDINEELENGL